MTDLRYSGRSEDGTFVELTDDNGNEYRLPLEDQLRSAIAQPRLVAVSGGNYPDRMKLDDETVVTVKEIQSRLRAGETILDLARSTGWSSEKIEKFSGPILQERAYIISVALTTQLRRESNSPSLGNATKTQLAPRGVNMDEVEWNTARAQDGSWKITIIYPTREGTAGANWSFDIHNHTLIALDEGAKWIGGEEKEMRAKVPTHGMVYQTAATTPAPRLVAVREEESVEEEAKQDGVTKRSRIPSWDDIMFGEKNKSE